MEVKTRSISRSVLPKPSREELFARMFELGRLIKSEMTLDCPVPSLLHAETLRFIQEEGQPTMRELAVYLKVTPPTVTSLVDAFVEDRVLERVTDAEDRRKVRIRLSRKGEKLLGELKRAREQAFARVFAPLSDADCRDFARILGIITSPRPARRKQ